MYEIFRILDYELDVLAASYDRQRSSTNTATNVNHKAIRWESCPIEAYNDSQRKMYVRKSVQERVKERPTNLVK